MAQVTIYIDDPLLKKIEASAKAEKKSLSAWVRAKLEESLSRGWNQEFLDTYGAWANLDAMERPAQPELGDDAPRESF
jgi:hypothetical protein